MGDIKKEIKIITGSCKRLLKEIESYRAEVLVQKDRIDRMRNDGADAYDIKKQQQVLEESEGMIPIVQKQFQTQLEKLIEKLDVAQEDAGIIESQEYKDADAIIQAHC
eukprot:CAMPEP_0201509144 /NCGR_PEP_ID=MMETSP0161_2-20130828/2278_1 /ASSEMBLY_ACC=CAM_ASM_000251 /TAXON_ID=180227 /ORGANISM="Neoparamoeba aestuarina, Strain SoJaBio B1-5/56/2" /LENGTH=107 /DNA_ID=CAMNT_0047903999 /DNA_START=64 /DNA_END=387 /DNA_ORIENTATION=-